MYPIKLVIKFHSCSFGSPYVSVWICWDHSATSIVTPANTFQPCTHKKFNSKASNQWPAETRYSCCMSLPLVLLPPQKNIQHPKQCSLVKSAIKVCLWANQPWSASNCDCSSANLDFLVRVVLRLILLHATLQTCWYLCQKKHEVYKPGLPTLVKCSLIKSGN